MRILGLDPSITGTGYAIVNSKEVEEHGLINIPPKDKENQLICYRKRSTYIADIIFEKMRQFHYRAKANIHKIDYVAIETPFLGKSKSIYGKLSFLQGVVSYSMRQYFGDGFADKLYWYAPRFIKEVITGSGRADKEQVLKMVKIMTDYKGKQLDISDAIAVALTCERDILKGIPAPR